MRRRATESQKDILFMAQEGLCAACGVELRERIEADHIQPFIEKGVTELWNMQILCLRCHRLKTSAEARRRHVNVSRTVY